MAQKASTGRDRQPRTASLSREQAVYDANLSRWARGHEGEFVLIKGEETVGFYATRDAALEVGYARFGVVPLFVRRVLPDEPIRSIPHIRL
jgi:hypothetical protein